MDKILAMEVVQWNREGTRVDKPHKKFWPGVLFGKFVVMFFATMLLD
jgi:hypothetical protein